MDLFCLKNKHALMAALYLLTADWKLWNSNEKSAIFVIMPEENRNGIAKKYHLHQGGTLPSW